MTEERVSLLSRVTLILLGIIPIAAASLMAIQRLWSFRPTGATFSCRGTLLIGLIGLALLSLPQLLLEGFVDETLWVLISGASVLLAVILACSTERAGSKTGAGIFTLIVATLVLVGPTVALLGSSGHTIPWLVNHNNVLAALVTMVAVATVPMYKTEVFGLSLTFLMLAAVLVAAVTGSRTALFAIAAGLLATLAVSSANPKGNWRLWLLAILGISAVLTVMLVGPLASRVLGLLPTQPLKSTNLVIGSEELESAYWTKRGVQVFSSVGNDGLNEFRIYSSHGRALDRVHQRFVLNGGEIRTLAFEYSQVGFDGGIVGFSEPSGSMIVPLIPSGQAVVDGNPKVLSLTLEPATNGWTLARLTVQNNSELPVVWRVGFSPTLRNVGSAELSIRHIRVLRGSEDSGYKPSYEVTRMRELAAVSASQRLGYARGVLSLVMERPLLGHGSSKPFYELLADYSFDGGLTSSNRPEHAHSLIGDVLVRFGLLGLVGFLTLLFAAILPLPRGQRFLILPFFVVVFVLGLGDATFFSAGGPFVLAYLVMASDTKT